MVVVIIIMNIALRRFRQTETPIISSFAHFPISHQFSPPLFIIAQQYLSVLFAVERFLLQGKKGSRLLSLSTTTHFGLGKLLNCLNLVEGKEVLDPFLPLSPLFLVCVSGEIWAEFS